MVIMSLLPHLGLFLPQLLLAALFTYLVIRLLKIISGKGWRANKAGIDRPPPPPGSCGLPFVGETLAFIKANNSSKGLYDFVQKRRDRYGSCFKTKIFGETHVFVSSIESAKTILGNESSDFSKKYMRSIAELLGDQSLLCTSHEHHKVIRRHISSFFTFDSMTSTMKIFDDMVVKAMKSWDQGGNVLVLNEALKITFRAICKMLVSLERNEEIEMLEKDVSEVTEAMLSFPLKVPGTRFHRGLKARRRIMNFLGEKIVARRKGIEYHEDFLHSFIRHESEFAGPLTDSVILDNMLTLIIAGQITTASAIAWMIKYLHETEEVQEKLRLELKPKNHDSSIGIEALNDMSYASKIVKESLRMATIVSWFPRIALKDCQIEGFHVQKGWIINVDARSIHFDPTFYSEPLNFNPSRFDKEPIPYSFLAFGVGGRTCLGMKLAKTMMLVFLHRLVTTYRWKVTDPDSSLEKWAMFPRLRSGCPIRITPLAPF